MEKRDIEFLLFKKVQKNSVSVVGFEPHPFVYCVFGVYNFFENKVNTVCLTPGGLYIAV